MLGVRRERGTPTFWFGLCLLEVPTFWAVVSVSLAPHPVFTDVYGWVMGSWHCSEALTAREASKNYFPDATPRTHLFGTSDMPAERCAHHCSRVTSLNVLVCVHRWILDRRR